MDTQFLETVFADSIQHPNFFNGRILTATDLRDEQAANLKRSRYLGQAIGTGVVQGLNVSASDSRTALQVTGGLAINRRGDAIYLPGDTTTVNLVLTERSGTVAPSPFTTCEIGGATTTTGVVSSSGYYLLVLTTATRLSTQMAPNSGLNGDQAGCTNRYEEVGVQFRLVPLTHNDFVTLDLLPAAPPGTPRPITPAAADSRSRLAHVCLGTHQLARFAGDPLRPSEQYGLVDALRATQRLTDCDVPLAVFLFRTLRVQFVDRWAVRRPYHPNAVGSGAASNASTPDRLVNYVYNTAVSNRRTLEAAAFLLQFQTQLNDTETQIRADIGAAGGQPVATKYFEFLPAAGYLPLPPDRTSTAESIDFARRFFGPNRLIIPSVNTLPVIDGAALRGRFHDSFYEPPIDLTKDAVEIYRVANQPYIMFCRDRRQGNRAIAQLLPGNGEQGTRVSAMVFGRHLADAVSMRFYTARAGGDNALTAQILPGGAEGWVPIAITVGRGVPPGNYPFVLETVSQGAIDSAIFEVTFEVRGVVPPPPPTTTFTIAPTVTVGPPFTIDPNFTLEPTFTIAPTVTVGPPFTIDPNFTLEPIFTLAPPIGSGPVFDQPIFSGRGVGELQGLNTDELAVLSNEGINNLAEFAALEPRRLAPLLSISEVGAMGLIDQARRQLLQ